MLLLDAGRFHFHKNLEVVLKKIVVGDFWMKINNTCQRFVYFRPLSNNEKKKGCFNVVDSSPQTKEIHVRERLGNISNTKTFHFDKVFGPNAKQIEVYKTVVVPILDEVVMGYNCTVFA